MSNNNLNTKTIVFCLDGFRHGGTQQAVIHLLPFMCAEFNKAYLIILQKNQFDLQLPNINNLEILKFNSRKFFDISLFINLLFFFWKIGPDVIIASMFRSMIFSTLAKNIKSKVFWLEQNTYTNRTKVQWLFLRLLIHRVNKIICISNDVATYSGKYLDNLHRFEVIPNPIWIPGKNERQLNRGNDFIFVGRLVPQKNPDLLLEAFDMFLKTYKENSHLHIVGDGELRKSLEMKLNNLGILDRCSFHGFLPNLAVYELMKQVKSLVSTSVIEGLAMVRLEALANGNCIVTTNSGGTEQFFHTDSDSGIFIAEPNPTDLAKWMHSSLNAKYHQSEMIEYRRAIAGNFSPEKISGLFSRLFNSE